MLINGVETIATTELFSSFFFLVHHCCCRTRFLVLFNWMIWFEHAFYFSPISIQLLYSKYFNCSNVNHFLHHINDIFTLIPCRCFHCTFHTVCDERCSHKRSHKFAMKFACVLAGPKLQNLITITRVYIFHIFSRQLFSPEAQQLRRIIRHAAPVQSRYSPFKFMLYYNRFHRNKI